MSHHLNVYFRLLFGNSKTFLIDSKDMKFKEGTIEGDRTVIGAYALRVTRLLHFLHEFILVNKQGCQELAFADDFFVAGKIKEIKTYWEML